jgi:Dehydrogenases with different specificities (related to short-chain alcohol dehydrogenases)
MLADIDEAGAEAAARELREAGVRAEWCRADVGDKGEVDIMVAQTLDKFGGLDVAVNNAGIVVAKEFLDMSEEDFDRVLRVNLKGVFLTGQAAARGARPLSLRVPAPFADPSAD